MKIEFYSSQKREMLLFLTTNMATVMSRANQQLHNDNRHIPTFHIFRNCFFVQVIKERHNWCYATFTIKTFNTKIVHCALPHTAQDTVPYNAAAFAAVVAAVAYAAVAAAAFSSLSPACIEPASFQVQLSAFPAELQVAAVVGRVADTEGSYYCVDKGAADAVGD